MGLEKNISLEKPIPPWLNMTNSELLENFSNTIRIAINKDTQIIKEKSAMLLKRTILNISEIDKGVSILSLNTKKTWLKITIKVIIENT